MAGVKRWINPSVWLLLAAALASTGWSAMRWLQVAAINAKIRDGSIDTLPAAGADPRLRYAAGWQAERKLQYADAVQMYTDAQAPGDPVRAARAWFALGNVYFKIGIVESRKYEATVGPVFENAQFDLARDAYRSALRIAPGLPGARYNLELLERLAPVRHLQGFRRNTDPIMLVPDRHNGWTSMQDDNKRGLP
jgi:tetratricopeptide (TPR) repeat protein